MCPFPLKKKQKQKQKYTPKMVYFLQVAGLEPSIAGQAFAHMWSNEVAAVVANGVERAQRRRFDLI